jgi:hypothetical protein
MSQQTEAEANISDIIRKNIKDSKIRPRQFEKVTIQTFVGDDGRKAMLVKLPKDLLMATQLSYAGVIKAAKQQFSDYYIMFARDFELDGRNEAPTTPQERYRIMLCNLCFPFLPTGTRTDCTPGREVVNVLLEKRCSLKPSEMEMIASTLKGLYRKDYAVAVNQHTRN